MIKVTLTTGQRIVYGVGVLSAIGITVLLPTENKFGWIASWLWILSAGSYLGYAAFTGNLYIPFMRENINKEH